MIMPTSSRDHTDTIATPPTGWTQLSVNSNVTWNYIFGRIAVGGDTAPTVTYTGTNQHHAQIASFTGPNVYTDLTTIVSGFVDNFAPINSVDMFYSALLPSTANCLCIAFATKNKTSVSDGSSVNDLAGFTRAGTLTNNGTTIATWWGYQQQTTATSLSAATQTRTGAAETLQFGTMYLALKTLPNASHIGAASLVMNQG